MVFGLISNHTQQTFVEATISETNQNIMDMLYKVDIIEGKNLGCIALKTIKRGALIVQEKPVCYDGGQIKEGCN